MTISHDNGEDHTPVNEWITYGMRLGVSCIIHPIEYSKTLMQLGYEPIPPRVGKTIFGKSTLILPNVFQYTGYIKRMDGIIGCYRGVGPKLVGNILSSYGCERVAEKLGLGYIPDLAKDEEELSDEENLKKFQMQMKRDIVMHVSGIIISHPFHVISLRMMAEFIGRDGKYLSLFGSITEVYRDDGIFGFFSGIVPRILYDVSCLVLVSSTTYYVHRHLIKDRESRGYFTSISQFVFSSILYPLNVVSTCMAVNGPGLQAGRPPNMPNFTGWRDCWRYLSATNSLKRGSSLFFRYYNPNFGKTAFSQVPMPDLQLNTRK